MTNQIVKEYLPQDLWEIAQNFVIPQDYLENNSMLIEKILRSRSIDTKEEKQNWFNLLPMMNVEQVKRLENILLKEQKKLEEIEQKYEKKKQEIQKKYVDKREEAGYSRKVSEIRSEEEEHQEQAENEADQLLEGL